MYDFHRNLIDIFCCFPLRSQQNDNTPAASLDTFHPAASTPSVLLPHTTVPHSSSEDISDDTKVLRRIFSSSSSIRGYQTAATTPGYVPTSRPSLDQDFIFGSTTPETKPQGRLEQLGQHIKQKLSESRLSRTSSKPQIAHATKNSASTTKSELHDADTLAPLGVSQSSVGLTEILASRNVSAGGYDSDAHFITTPKVRSNAGTIRLSPAFIKQTLNQTDTNKDASSDPISGKLVTEKSSDDALQTHIKVESSPYPAPPLKTSFTTAIKLVNNESPSDALRRLSVGIADGTIKIPTTPELRAMRMPDVAEIENNWQIAAPERTSSLTRADDSVHKDLKRLSHRVEQAKEGVSGDPYSDDNRTTLISELDPDLIDYMSRYAERYSTDERHPSSLEINEAKQDDADRNLQHPSSASPLADIGINSASRSNALPNTSEADEASIHLFNMRISQRLASQSQLPVVSPTHSINAVTRSLSMSGGDLTVGKRESNVTVTRFFTQVAAEHNRRPSDPLTRQLFESADRRRTLNSTWKTVTTFKTDKTPSATNLSSRDDASSYYNSDGPAEALLSRSDYSTSTRYLNPHSLAVGGRSASAAVSPRQGSGGSQRPSTAGAPMWQHRKPSDSRMSSEDIWLEPGSARMRGRSASMPQKASPIPAASPTLIPRRLRENTDVAENLSEVSLRGVQDRRNENLSAFDAVDAKIRKDERFSEAEHNHRRRPDSQSEDTYPAFPNFTVSFGQNAGHIYGTHKDEKVKRNSLVPEIGITECATSMWGRAFRNARDDHGERSPRAYLTASRFDRDGRRRSTRSTTSDTSWEPTSGRASFNAPVSNRSLSADGIRRPSSVVNLDEHQRMCVAAKTPLPSKGPRITVVDADGRTFQSKTLKETSEIKKGSILDIGRRFASASGPTQDNDVRQVETPTVESLGIWGRFSSHDRAERNSIASAKDGVVSKDFHSPGDPVGDQVFDTPRRDAITKLTLTTPKALMKLNIGLHKALNRSRTKSMPMRLKKEAMPVASKQQKGKQGLMDRWRRLYRSSSSELRKHAMGYGHRSSIGVGDAVEYPELECLPGEGMFKETEFQKMRSMLSGSFEGLVDVPSEDTAMPESAEMPRPRKKPAAVDWGKVYGECVGSMSALRTTTEVDALGMNLSDTFSDGPPRLVSKMVADPSRLDIRSLELRDSTTDFSRALAKEQERIREELLGKVEELDRLQVVQMPVSKDKDVGKDEIELTIKDEEANLTALPAVTPPSASDKDKRLSKDLKVPGGFE